MLKVRMYFNRVLLKFVMWATDGVQCEVTESTLVAATAHRYRSKKPIYLDGTHLEFNKGCLFLYVVDWKP